MDDPQIEAVARDLDKEGVFPGTQVPLGEWVRQVAVCQTLARDARHAAKRLVPLSEQHSTMTDIAARTVRVEIETLAAAAVRLAMRADFVSARAVIAAAYVLLDVVADTAEHDRLAEIFDRLMEDFERLAKAAANVGAMEGVAWRALCRRVEREESERNQRAE